MRLYIHLLFALSLFICCLPSKGFSQQSTFILNGTVVDASSGEALPQAVVWIDSLKLGTTTDINGNFTLNLKAGSYRIEARYMGYENSLKTIQIKRNQYLVLALEEKLRQLNDVVIMGKEQSQVDKNTMGVEHLSVEHMKKMPMLMGEADLLKSVQMLPGIIMSSEGSSGFSVRGGSPDQNFIFLDKATVYNPSHALGFFSIFNNDIMSGASVYKGDIPVQFGGRLSSVVDATMKEGDFYKYHITGGIGILLARLAVEGPIVKDRLSFVVSGRRTYFDAFLPAFGIKDVKLYFYDATAKLVFRSKNRKDKLSLSGYLGRDVFGMKSMNADMDYGNKALSLTWTHFINKDFVMNTSALISDYRYLLGMKSDMYAIKWKSHLTDYGGKMDFIYNKGSHDIRFGFSSTYHICDPGDISIQLLQMSFLDTNVNWGYAQERFNTWENGLYVGNDQKIGKHFMIKYGIRFSSFTNIGADSVYYFNNGNISGVDYFKKGEFYNTYWGIEPRIGATYLFDSSMSLKFNYSRTVQYNQMAQTSTSGNPLDIWFPANPTLLPQTADQVALGFEKDFKDGEWQTSIELYYRYLQNVVDFKDHAQLIGNRYLYREVSTGTGMAYGLEVELKRNRGIVNGSLSYTLSKSTRKVKDVNKGEIYPSPYDRPHAIQLLLNVEPHPRHSLSFNWVFYSGLPTNYPQGKAIVDGNWIPIYGERNSDRMPNYHRLDIAYTLHSKQNPKRRFSWDLSVGCYNAYARKNPWSITFKQDKEHMGQSYAEMIYLFSAVPSITFNFKW